MGSLEASIVRLVAAEPGITSLKVYYEIRKKYLPPRWAINTFPRLLLEWVYPPLGRVHATIERLEKNSLIRSETVYDNNPALVNTFTLRRLYPIS